MPSPRDRSHEPRSRTPGMRRGSLADSSTQLSQLRLEISQLQRELKLREASQKAEFSRLEEKHRRHVKDLKADFQSRLSKSQSAHLEDKLAERQSTSRDDKVSRLESECQQLRLSLKAAERQLSQRGQPSSSGRDSSLQQDRKKFPTPQKNACCETLRFELNEQASTIGELRTKLASKHIECTQLDAKVSEMRADARESARAHERAQSMSQQEMSTLREEIERLKEYLALAETRLESKSERNRALKAMIDERLEALQTEFSEKIRELEGENVSKAERCASQEAELGELRSQLSVYWEMLVATKGQLEGVMEVANQAQANVHKSQAVG